MFSFDQLNDDVVRLLKICKGLDFSKECSEGRTEFRFPLLEGNQHRFQIELVDLPEFYQFWFLVLDSSDIPLWHRGDDRISRDAASAKESVSFLVGEVCRVLSHPSKVIMKKGIIFTSSSLLIEIDGEWKPVRLARMVSLTGRNRFHGLGMKESFAGSLTSENR
jgi:hypothetical protein